MSGNKFSKERAKELLGLNELMDELFDSLSIETRSFIGYFDSNDQEMIRRINDDLSKNPKIKKALSGIGIDGALTLSHANSFRVKSLLEEAKTSTNPNIVKAAEFARRMQDQILNALLKKEAPSIEDHVALDKQNMGQEAGANRSPDVLSPGNSENSEAIKSRSKFNTSDYEGP